MVTYEQLLDRDLDWALREDSMHFEGTSVVHKTLQRLANRLDPSLNDSFLAKWSDAQKGSADDM